MPLPSPILPAGSRAPASPRPEPAPTAVAHDEEGLIAGAVRRAREFAADMRSPAQALPWIVIACLVPLLMYSYWPGLLNARSSWDNPQYQHGWIVPVVTVLLLFWWRKPVTPVTNSARLAGFGLLIASFLLRLFCASYRIVTIDMYTFVPALAGVFLIAGGWSMFRWAWAPILSLIFMYPLPDEATRYLLGPLQTVATIVSTYSLQTLGFDAYRDGNRIILGDGQVLGVVDACSGLKMLTIFLWLAVMLIMVGGLEWWENVVIAASAIPIALVCNATRITTVGVMYNYNAEMAEGFHDSLPAAVMMMVMAVGMLVLVMKVLSYLVVTDDTAPTMVAAAGGGRPAMVPAMAAKAAPAGVAPVAVLPVISRGLGATAAPVRRPADSTENMG